MSIENKKGRLNLEIRMDEGEENYDPAGPTPTDKFMRKTIAH